jgi:hypothetical protein
LKGGLAITEKMLYAAFGDIMTAYRAEYPNAASDDAAYNLPKVRFEDTLPSILKA